MNTNKETLGVLSLVLWMTLPLLGISSPYVIGVPGVYWGNFIFFVIGNHAKFQQFSIIVFHLSILHFCVALH